MPNTVCPYVANCSLAFPAVTKQAVQEQTFMNFLNLNGVDSPLPHYLLELCYRSKMFNRLLQLINNFFYQHLYALQQQFCMVNNKEFYQTTIASWLGFANNHPLSAYTDILCQCQGLSALRRCLSRLLGSMPFSVQTFKSQWQALSGLSLLGPACCLNKLVLNHRFYCHEKGVTVSIGPMAKAQQINVSAVLALCRAFKQSFSMKIIIDYQPSPLCLGKCQLSAAYHEIMV